MERTNRELNHAAAAPPVAPENFMVAGIDAPDKPLRELSNEELANFIGHMENDIAQAQVMLNQCNSRQVQAVKFCGAAQFELERRKVQASDAN